MYKNSAKDFVLFNTIRCGDYDDILTQQQFISFSLEHSLQLFRYNENPVSYLRAILFAYFSSKRVRNLQGCQKTVCKRLKNLLILVYCFVALEFTVTIPSEVLSPGKVRHHILLVEELSPQISSFDMIFESTSLFIDCHEWMF